MHIVGDALLILSAGLIFWATSLIVVYRWDRDKFHQSPSFERTVSTNKGYANKCRTAKRIVRNVSLCFSLQFLASVGLYIYMYLTESVRFLITVANICFGCYLLTRLYTVIEIALANARMNRRSNDLR